MRGLARPGRQCAWGTYLLAAALVGCTAAGSSATDSAQTVLSATAHPDTAKPGSTVPTTFPPTLAPSLVPANAGPAPTGIPMPDHSLTPGSIVYGVTAQQVCTPGYARSVRNVSAAEKEQVFAEYHLAPARGEYEVDHLIALELGGSNSITNLWPEPYDGPYGAHAKDSVENKLHALVCAGRMSLSEAQNAIATRWWTYL